MSTPPEPKTPDLRGKGAIVTGGGSGICNALVRRLFAAGANVLIADIGLHKQAQDWLDSVNYSKGNGSSACNGPRVVFSRTDVTDWSQLENVFDVYAKEFGGTPYVVCPGAGVYEPSAANFWNERETQSYKILEVNLVHPIRISRIAIRRWVQASEPGNLVLISSVAAQKSSLLTPLYGASKHGISCFVRSMAGLYDLEKIRVTAVAPGPTMSPLFTDNPVAIRFIDKGKDKLCDPDEIARGLMGVAFIESGFKPGTILEVTHPNQWREVQLLNDPGPGAHTFPSKKSEGIVDVKAALEQDRNGAKAS